MESMKSGSSTDYQVESMDDTKGAADDAVDPEGVTELEIREEDEFLRLLFDSEAYKDGSITDEAIMSRDLNKNGFSLDIKRVSKIEAIESRAQSQAAKILAKDPSSEKRRVPYISSLLSSEINNCQDEEGRKLFETFHTPEPDNYAHASLYCVLRDEGKRYYVYARNQIRPLLEKNIMSLADYKRSI